MMGFGVAEIVLILIVSVIGLGIPAAVIIFGVMIYRKLDRIERLLQDRNE